MAAQAETRPDVSVVIVTYNVCALLERCLGSLVAAAAGVRYEVIVVDNGSGDGTWPLIAARPDVRALRGARSLGFPRANNLGIACARGRHVLILNPDTELGPGALAALVRRLDMDPGLGIVGPRLRLPSGVLDPACRRSFPTWRSAALRLLRVPPRGWLGRDHAYNLAHESPDVECAVDAVSAACMLVRGDALRAVHGFDPGYFMYGEDLDLARRLRNAGWRAVYFPQAEVVHNKRQSSRQREVRTRYEFYRAMWRYYRTHGRDDPWMLRGVVLGGIVALGAAAVLRRLMLRPRSSTQIARRP